MTVGTIVRQATDTHRANNQPVAPIHRLARVAAMMDNASPAGYLTDPLDDLGEAADGVGRIVGPSTVDLWGERVEALGKGVHFGITRARRRNVLPYLRDRRTDVCAKVAERDWHG